MPGRTPATPPPGGIGTEAGDPSVGTPRIARFRGRPPRLIPLAGAALAAAALASPAHSSPESLRQEIERFAASPRAEGMRFTVAFAETGTTGVPGTDGAPGGSAADSTRTADPVLIARGETEPLIPASLTKLVTTLAALEELGPAYTFGTQVLGTGPLGSDGVLEGDLVLVGEGDPFLVSERLWLLANRLRQTGLRRVAGRLLLDSTAFADPDSSGGIDGSRSRRSYAARPSALAVNFNSVGLLLTPGDSPGDPVGVAVDPLPLGYLQIENRLKTSAPGHRPERELVLLPTAAGAEVADSSGNGASRDPDPPFEVARLTGTLPAGDESRHVYASVAFPVEYAGSLFRACLAEAGIVVDGPAVVGTAPPDADSLLQFDSLPLSELLVKMDHYSNNFMANQIALAVFRHHALGLDPARSTPATLAGAGAYLTGWVRSQTGADSSVVLRDGSGLSPEDRLTGRAILDLLREGWANFQWHPKLLGSLPGPGEEGTLKERFPEGSPPALCAKTGTIQGEGVSGIAGYLGRPGADPVAFVMLMNGPHDGEWTIAEMRDTQDEWIREFLR